VAARRSATSCISLSGRRGYSLVVRTTAPLSRAGLVDLQTEPPVELVALQSRHLPKPLPRGLEE
jgi:hypothetical protein